MATWVIGDIHGCFDSLQQWLATTGVDVRHDRLWLVGDLVNRGPRSLDCLRWAWEHRNQVTLVLGNHDIHLLACAWGVSEFKRKDTLEPILRAPDRQPLLDWLRHQPLLVTEGALTMVHAGIWPRWTLERAHHRARLAEAELQVTDPRDFLAHIVRDRGICPAMERVGDADPATTLSVLTRMRTLYRVDHALNHSFKSTRAAIPADCVAWCDVPGVGRESHTVVFGHWAALGREDGPGYRALDSGCVWGQELTGWCVESGEVHKVTACDRGEP
jgi:bis(5'-nucleosyl)-tetraphosphatase (symmetrical)